jgi:hypothetical protein
VDQRRALQTLVKSQAWDLLLDFINAQIHVRENKLKRQAGGLEGMIEKEVILGEIMGMELFARSPELIIEDLDIRLEGSDYEAE